MLTNLQGIHPDALTDLIKQDFPAYRAKQLLKWLYTFMETDTTLMSDLPAPFKTWINETFRLEFPKVDAVLVSRDKTRKYRLQLPDNSSIECVLIPENKKRTLCISSQVGCGRGCTFCATATMGIKRNLDVHEIVQQILLVSKDELPERLTNIVLMGMGEPMDNLDNVLEAVRLIQHPATLAFSPRRTTLSTCGVVPGIAKLADSGVKLKLAVSLNSAIDKIRNEIMPVNKRFPLNDLKRALQYFNAHNPFRITLEYIMIPGLNMDMANIRALRRFAGDLSCKINFIPFNPVPGLPFAAPDKNSIDKFIAMAQCIPQAVTLRKSRGGDVMGACGQLALAQTSKNKE